MKPELAPPLWKDQTCQSCIYRVGERCRRIPPATGAGTYPQVQHEEIFNGACAEWKRDPMEEMQ